MDKDEFPLVDVIRLKPMDGHNLWLRFSNGREGIRDLSQYIASGGPMVEPLKDPAFFARVFVESGVPTWPNGFDLDAIALYLELRDAGALSQVNASAAE
jgi:hypothetical protein